MDKITDRLTDGDLHLRPLDKADLTAITGHFNDARVARWLAAVARPFGPEAAQELLEHAAHPGESLRVIELGGKVAGGLCIGASLWYWLAPEFWRQGLMRRALKLAIAARFANMGPPVTATCHADNMASRALLTGLGFSRCPAKRRMFFHGTQTSEPCCDYVMSPEQWHLLYPPVFAAGVLSLRPARQQDAPALAQMLPVRDKGPWPDGEELPRFIETHRCRAPGRGLFVVTDDNRRSVGMALVTASGPHLRFASEAEDTRHRAQVMIALADAPFAGR